MQSERAYATFYLQLVVTLALSVTVLEIWPVLYWISYPFIQTSITRCFSWTRWL